MFLIELHTASTHAWWLLSALYAIANVPVHGLIASASAHSFLASSGLYARTSAPARLSLQPEMTGDVKSLAGVRVPSKITFVISSRLIDIDRA